MVTKYLHYQETDEFTYSISVCIAFKGLSEEHIRQYIEKLVLRAVWQGRSTVPDLDHMPVNMIYDVKQKEFDYMLYDMPNCVIIDTTKGT